MKTLLLTALLTICSAAFTKNKDQHPIMGTWKYSNQSVVNDLQPVLNTVPQNAYTSEYFTFGVKNNFKHEFFNEKGEVVKTLTGKWKSMGDKVKIEYNDIHYSIFVDYFFLDNDLVLGQNFNHVIFTRNDVYNLDLSESGNTAMK
jgi:hypothetical protein